MPFDEGRIEEILGKDTKPGEQGRSGGVVFLDALPLCWPRLDIDIITRHHDAEKLSEQAVPLDADEPNPLHFLTVAPNETFVFRLLPTRAATQAALDLAWSWLAAALDVLGAGAKTAVGYGQMVK